MSCSTLDPKYWMHWDPSMQSSLDESAISTAHRLQECSLFADDALAELLSRYPRTDIRVTTMGRTFEHSNELQEGELGDLTGAELLHQIRSGRLRLQLLRLGARRDALASLTRNLGREVDECLNSSFELESATVEVSSPDAIQYLDVETVHQCSWQIRGQRSIRLFPDSESTVNSHTKYAIASGLHSHPLYYEPAFEAMANAVEQSQGQLATIPAWHPFLIRNSNDLNVVLTTRHQTAQSRRLTEIHRANHRLQKFIPVRPPQQTGVISGWLKQRLGALLPTNNKTTRPSTFTVTAECVDKSEQQAALPTVSPTAPIQIDSPTQLTAETSR